MDQASIAKFGSRIMARFGELSGCLIASAKTASASAVNQTLRQLMHKLEEFDLSFLDRSEKTTWLAWFRKDSVLLFMQQYLQVDYQIYQLVNQLEMQRTQLLRNTARLRRFQQDGESILCELNCHLVATEQALVRLPQLKNQFELLGQSRELARQYQFSLTMLVDANQIVLDQSHQVLTDILPGWRKQLATELLLLDKYAQTATVEAALKILRDGGLPLERAVAELRTNSRLAQVSKTLMAQHNSVIQNMKTVVAVAGESEPVEATFYALGPALKN